MSLIAQHADLYLFLACLFGFFMAWGIGANDVANAMGTSVGSGAVKLWQAVVIAGVFEFLGAWLAGDHVTQTISSGLIHPDIFADDPDVLATGMLASLLGAATFMALLSIRSLPVSSGQSIIGGILGFALVAVGTQPVDWGEILSIVVNWFTSPLVAGVIAFLVFESIRRLILARSDPLASARRYTPYYVFVAVFVFALALLQSALAYIGLSLSTSVSVAAACVLGFAAAGASRLLLQRIRVKSEATYTQRYHRVERAFGYIQILTAATMAFAQGSMDVANAMGPVAAIADTARHPDHIGAGSELAGWILMLGGIGIVFGLFTYGHKVMRTIGASITQITPTRGFSAELSAAATVLVDTWIGLPVSTTQTIVGAVLGVGLARGIRALDLSVLGSVFSGWALTVPGSALFAAVFYFILRALIG
jgi:PiT family inorganic phosphate transporter